MNTVSEPLVSICIPAFNSEKWIRSTIKSALDQTWPNKEIIIIDDGSTDNTYKIAKEYEAENVQVLTHKNSGACSARNLAFSLSKGDFIQWLDADDILHPDKIAVQLSDSQIIQNHKIVHTAAWGYFYYRLSNSKFQPSHLWKDMSSKDWLLERFQKGSYMATATWLVSRKLSEIAGPWDETLLRNQDGEYFARVVSFSDYVKFHPLAKSFYRKGNLNSISSLNNEKKIESIILSMSKSTSYLLKIEDTNVTRQACIKYFQDFYNKYYFHTNRLLSVLISNEIEKLGGNFAAPKLNFKLIFLIKILGYKRAFKLKLYFWNLEVLLKKYLENFLTHIFKDQV
ncbi:MAG: glycosyltransferase family 2 protein [Ignavibacterium sp.]|jgi:glycosyltransferase involved in cell wall biosynthesis|nr:glycosyltransferase family 2 protein [Ignavibacterium sp.]